MDIMIDCNLKFLNTMCDISVDFKWWCVWYTSWAWDSNLYQCAQLGWALFKIDTSFDKKMNKSHCCALRRRRRGEESTLGEAASWLHWKGKVWSIARFRLYPARLSKQRLGTRLGGLGETQAVTVWQESWGNLKNLSWKLWCLVT
jgi:hypothetical protein